VIMRPRSPSASAENGSGPGLLSGFWTFSLLAYVALAPIGVRLGFLGPQYGAQPLLFAVLVSAAFVSLVLRRRRVPLPTGARSILLYMAWAAVTLLWTPDRSIGMQLWLYRLHIIAPAAWFSVALVVQSRVKTDAVIDAYIGVSVLATVLSFVDLGAVQTERLSLVEDYNPSWLGGFLSLGVLASAWRLRRVSWAPRRGLFVFAGGVSLIGVVFTQTRNSLAALLVGAVLTVAVHYLHAALERQSVNATMVQALKGLILVSVGAGVAWMTYRGISDATGVAFSDLDRLGRTLSGVSASTTTAGRSVIWARGLQFFTQPVWGLGYGSFPVLYEARFGQYTQAHNLYLQVAVDTGVIGLGIVISFFLSAWRRVWASRSTFAVVWTFWYLVLLSIGNDAIGYKHFWLGWFMLMAFLSAEASDHARTGTS
jgi:O-Antigen ligase